MWPVAIPEAFAVVKVGNSAWLLQAHPLARNGRHGRRSAVVHHAETQSVGHEQNDIVRWRRRCLRESRERKGCQQDFRSEEEKPAHAQLQGLERESRLRVAHDSHVTTVESVAFTSIPTVDVLGRAEAELAG